jgi:hypothetical protein
MSIKVLLNTISSNIDFKSNPNRNLACYLENVNTYDQYLDTNKLLDVLEKNGKDNLYFLATRFVLCIALFGE